MLGIGSTDNGYFQGRDCNPFASVPAPVARSLVSGPDGVSLNRFGWADAETGQVSNAYEAGSLLGLVLPQPFRYARNGWNLAYWSAGALILRPGQIVTMAAQGDFWVRFPAGAIVGSQVYASYDDGTPWILSPVLDSSNGQIVLDSHGQPVLSSQAPGGSFATPWTCMTSAPPFAPVLISSFAKPF